MELVYYPVNDFGPVMKGMIIGGLGIFHVFVAQFAIGGGMLMLYFQWLAAARDSGPARRFLESYFKVLILVSFVIGALTGVGMWLTAIQISAPTIGLMIDEFHWVWATEWLFFWLEVIAGYAFYRYGALLTDRAKMGLLALYSAAAWGSLFWINGIITWQLTPGEWLANHDVWAGFFNPTFWPSLFFRTIVSMTLGSLAALVVINATDGLEREERAQLIGHAARFLAPMVAMPFLGAWFLAELPPDSRSWVLGGSVAMTIFMSVAAGASLLIGLYASIGLLIRKLYINGATALLLCALAFAATAGGEFVREGVRKPFTVRELLYSNSIRKDDVELLRRHGAVAQDPYPLRDAAGMPNDQLRHGARVYRFLCSVCHTLDGANGLLHLTGSWTTDQKRHNIAKLQHTKPFMPPFAGNQADLEALVQFLEWAEEGRPGSWQWYDRPETANQVERWLEQAGTGPGEHRSGARKESR